MPELRPSCENCKKPLPPESTDALICTFECTFCAACVETVPHNFLGRYPASQKIKYRPVDSAQHEAFSAVLKSIAPAER
jgi:uncharacterized protein